MSKRAHITVTVKDENIEKKLRQFKKKIEREGIVREAKAQVYFESPCSKARKKKMRAVKLEMIRRTNSTLGGSTSRDSFL
jgi:small subunit ribosomal protein S21